MSFIKQNLITADYPGQEQNFDPSKSDSVSGKQAAAVAAQQLANFWPANGTMNALLDAATAANAAGGGIVNLLPQNMSVTQTIPVLEGVLYDGQNQRMTAFSPVDQTRTYVLTPTGNFDVFAGNSTAVGSAPTLPQFVAGQIQGGGIRNVIINGGKNGIKVGNTNNPGWMRAQLFNVLVQNCTEWGIWIENYFHMLNSGFLRASGCGIGQIHHGCSSGGVINTGNTQWGYQNIDGIGALAKGIEYVSKNSGSLYEMTTLAHGLAGGGTKTTQTFTFANGQSNITVSNPAALTVDMPLFFATSANGINAATTYFVKTIVGSTVTISINIQGSTFTATGNGGVSTVTYGHAPITIWGDTTAAGQPGQHFGVSIEGTNLPASLIISNAATQKVDLHLIGSGDASITRSLIIHNSSACRIDGNLQTSGISFELDGNSPGCRILGSMGQVNGAGYPSYPSQIPQGMWLYNGALGANGNPDVKNNTQVLALNGDGAPDIFVPATSTAGIGLQVATMLRESELPTGGALFSGSFPGNMFSLSGSAVTLPALNIVTGSKTIGLWGILFNPQAISVTVSRAGSDAMLIGGSNPINQGSFVLQPYGCAIIGIYTTASQSVPYWGVGIMNLSGYGTGFGAQAVSALPVASAALIGANAFVNNATQTWTAGIGAIVVGGGGNTVPVRCDGTNWRIG